MRDDGAALMDGLEAAFRVADGLDREGPERGGFGQIHRGVEAQPFIDEAESIGLWQVKQRLQLAEAAAVRVVEIAVGLFGGHAGEVEFDGEIQRLMRRKIFEDVQNFESGIAGVESDPLRQLDLVRTDSTDAREDGFDPFGRAA